MLTPGQIASFKAEGTLIFRDFFDQAQLSMWRAQAFAGMDADPGDPGSWPGSYVAPGGQEVAGNGGLGPALCELPSVNAILDQLIGVGRHRPGLRPSNPFYGEADDVFKETDNLIINWSERSAGATAGSDGWKPPTSGHLEGYNGNKGGWYGGYMMGFTTYLEDVAPAGGGMVYWPRSHHAIHKYFCANPDRIIDGCSVDPSVHGDTHNGKQSYSWLDLAG